LNYIQELNEFRNWALLNNLSTSEIVTLFALYQINNMSNWTKWFSVPNSTFQSLTGLSRESINQARNKLKQRKRIDFIQGKLTIAAKYKINYFAYDISDIEVDKEVDKEVDIEVDKEVDVLLPHTKTNNTNNTNKQEKYKKENTKKFVPPTIEEVKNYCLERKNAVDADKWVNYYTSNGWKVGKNPMKDWEAAVRTWEGTDKPKQTYQPQKTVRDQNIDTMQEWLSERRAQGIEG